MSTRVTMLMMGVLTLTLASGPAAAQNPSAAVTPTPPVQSGGYTLDAEVKPKVVRPGQPAVVDATVTASQPAQSQRVDLEILDAGNRKVAQQIYSDQSFAAGQTRQYRWTWQVPADFPPGDYTVKIGVFSPDWQTLAAWDNLAAVMRVAPSAPAPAAAGGVGFDLDAKVSPRQATPGQQVAIDAAVTASQPVQNRRVEIDVVNAKGERVAFQHYEGQSFAPGQSQRYRWVWQIPATQPPGVYSVQMAVMTPDRLQISGAEYRVALIQVGPPVGQAAPPMPGARVASPAPGATLPGSTATFSWAPVPGASEYRLEVGVAPGTPNFHASTDKTVSRTVTGLPTDGRAINVRLLSNVGGVWHVTDQMYRAATVATAR